MKVSQYPPVLAISMTGEIYVKKLNLLWKYCFGISALKFGTEETKLSSISIIILLVRIILTCYFFACFCFSVFNFCQIYNASNFLSATDNGILAICLFLTLHSRKGKFVALNDKIIAPIIRVDGAVEKVWRKCLISTFWFFTLTVVANLTSCVDVYVRDREDVEKYLQLYFFNVTTNDDTFVPLRTLFHVEIICVTLFILMLIDSGVVYFNHICQFLTLNFKHLNSELSLALLGDVASHSTFDIVYFRRKHQRVARWVNEISALFSPFLFLCLLAHMTNFCFDLRVLKETDSVLYFVCFSAIGIRHFTLLLSIAYNTSMIHAEASRTAEAITTASITQSTTSEINAFTANFILFGQRLSQSSVGINLFDFTTLSASSFIGMFGTMLTYIIILFQTP